MANHISFLYFLLFLFLQNVKAITIDAIFRKTYVTGNSLVMTTLIGRDTKERQAVTTQVQTMITRQEP